MAGETYFRVYLAQRAEAASSFGVFPFEADGSTELMPMMPPGFAGDLLTWWRGVLVGARDQLRESINQPLRETAVAVYLIENGTTSFLPEPNGHVLGARVGLPPPALLTPEDAHACWRAMHTAMQALDALVVTPTFTVLGAIAAAGTAVWARLVEDASTLPEDLANLVEVASRVTGEIVGRTTGAVVTGVSSGLATGLGLGGLVIVALLLFLLFGTETGRTVAVVGVKTIARKA